MTATSRLGLPLIVAGQAQKEVAHNEALALIDGCVAPCVEQRALASPPTSPVAGRCYLVAAGASGPWAGRTDQLAIATDGGWRFVVPLVGMRAWIASEDIEAVFRGGAWELWGRLWRTGDDRRQSGRRRAGELDRESDWRRDGRWRMPRDDGEHVGCASVAWAYRFIRLRISSKIHPKRRDLMYFGHS